MKERGVAVIMAMWLLAVLAIIGTTFAFMMRLEPIIARHQRNETMARYAAQAGVDYAVYLLKKDKDTSPTLDSLDEAWYTTFVGSDVDNDGDGTDDSQWIVLTDTAGNDYGFYAVRVTDEAGKININNYNGGAAVGDPWRTLMGELPYLVVGKVVDYIEGDDKNLGTNDDNPFDYKKEIICAPGAGWDLTRFTTYKERISAFPVVSSSLLSINVNTASQDVLDAVLDPVITSDTELTTVINGIINHRSGENPPNEDYTDGDENPFNDMAEFESCIHSLNIAPATYSDVKYNANGTDVVTTTFSFKSENYFDIVSTGEVRDVAGTNMLARKKIRAVLKRDETGSGGAHVIHFYEEIPEEIPED